MASSAGPVLVAKGQPEGVKIGSLAGAATSFGCTVENFDLAKVDGNPELVGWVYEMLHANKLIVFKGQTMKPLEFAAFGGNFCKQDGKFNVKMYTGTGVAGNLPPAKGRNTAGSPTAAPWREPEYGGLESLMIISNIDGSSLESGVLSWEDSGGQPRLEGKGYDRYKLDFSRASGKGEERESRKAGSMNAAAHWHTDMTFDAEPGANTMLYCQQTPDPDQTLGGGITSFCDTESAFRTLDEPLRLQADGLICGHANVPGKGILQVDGDIKLNKKELTMDGRVNQPDSRQVRWNTPDGSPKENALAEAVCYHSLVRPHPVTGKKALYSPCGTNVGVVGWSSADSFEFLSKITQHCLKPEYRYDHAYEKGDLVFWDVQVTMHRANPLPSATCPEDLRLMLRFSNQGVNPAIANNYQEGVHHHVSPPAKL